eukprot:970523-Pelagomonas_calceolata.AAC.9
MPTCTPPRQCAGGAAGYCAAQLHFSMTEMCSPKGNAALRNTDLHTTYVYACLRARRLYPPTARHDCVLEPLATVPRSCISA